MRLIDADEYIKKLRERIGIEPTWSHSGLRIAIFELHNMPTIVPVKHGRWVKHVLKNANVPWGYDCSACGEWFVIGDDTAERYKYCPNCGARMDEVTE